MPGTLQKRVSVCAGYANLFKALCDAANVKAVYVSSCTEPVRQQAW